MSFGASNTLGCGINPEPPRKPGQQVGDHRRRMELRVRPKVHDDLPGWRSAGLRLARSIAVDHGRRHQSHQLHRILAGDVVAPVVAKKLVRRSQRRLQALSLRGIFRRGNRFAVVFDQASDAALPALDDLADRVAFGVHLMDAVGHGACTRILDDCVLILRRGLDPGDG